MKKAPALYPIYPIDDLRGLLTEVSQRYSGRIALKSKKEGSYRPVTYDHLRERVDLLGTALVVMGLGKGDRVALLSENRVEWAVAYLAIVTRGLVALPIDKDLTARERNHILAYAKPRVLFCSEPFLEQIGDSRAELPFLEKVISMEEEGGRCDLLFPELLEQGRRSLHKGVQPRAKSELGADDLAVIIFTSGTTGNSKGVMLTHRNLVANIMATSQYVSIQDGVLLSVLPLHHAYECMAGFLLALYQGCTICYAESLRRVADNLRETGATVMIGVPLLFESFYRRIQQAIEQSGKNKFRLAMGVAGITERLLGLNLRRKLLRPIHQNLGGRLALMISGGAPLNPQVGRGFRELGIDFIQGYGMTEASPIVSVNRVDYFKDEAVGLPLSGLEVKIVDQEIWVRGPSVMKGYYLNEEATRETMSDGWLKTGDLGFLDPQGFLHINGRKKSVIVTANGKNVFPEEVENLLNESPYILESLVWGGPEEDPTKVEVQAIVVPQTEVFDAEYGPQCGEEMMREVIGREIKKRCQDLAQFKRVKKFVLRSRELEKTTTRKIKRHLYTMRPSPLPPEL